MDVTVKIEAPSLVFQNKNRNYPISRVPDDVPNVSYRSGPNDWIDGIVFPQYIGEKKVIRALPHYQKRILRIKNCSGRNINESSEEACKRANTELRFFPPNSTRLKQCNAET